MRFFAPVLLAFCALSVAAQEPAAKEHNDEWKADLKAAQDFADLLERAGEPDLTHAILVSFPGMWRAWEPDEDAEDPKPESATRPPAQSLREDYAFLPGGISGWLLPRRDERDTRVRVYFEDGLVRTLPRLRYGRTRIPEGMVAADPATISAWIVNGNTYGAPKEKWSERDSWRMAHWAAWHARMEQDAKAAAAWKAARNRIHDFPTKDPAPPPFERLVLAAARMIAAGSVYDEAELLQGWERLEAIASEPLQRDIAARVGALRDKQERRIAEFRGLEEDAAAQIHASLVQKSRESAAEREAKRDAARLREAARLEWEAARLKWIESCSIRSSELPLLSRALQAEYWIHRFPDWRSNVLNTDGPGRFVDSISQKGMDPCQQIFALGDDALPALVDAVGVQWETDTRFDGKPLTISDVCTFLIEQISGDAPLPHAEGDLFPGRHLTPEARKEAIEAWWNELKPLSAEDRWLILWKRGSRRAAGELIRLNARKHLPALVERADGARGRSRCIERSQLVEALRALPEGQLEDLEKSSAPESHEVIREALTK